MDDVERLAVERLAKAIVARRRALAMTTRRFALVAGIGESTLRNIENAVDASPQEETLFGIDRAAGAPSGTCARIIEGELDEFPPVPTPAQLELARRIAGLDALDAELLLVLLQRLGA